MIKPILITGFIVFVTLVLILYVFQRQLIYFPAKETPDRHRFHADDMQIITLHTDDGLSLNAWYKPAAIGKPTVLLAHGNASHMGYRMPLARQLIDKGYGVLLVEYRGYGGNQGMPTEQGLYSDARAGMAFLNQQGVSSQHVVLYGESLGTGVATKMATEYAVCAVVLQSPYTSLATVARYHYPWIFLSPRDKFDSFSRIRNIHAPLLILHGTKDSVVPFEEGLALFKQAIEPKQWVALPNKGHSQLWDADFIRDVSEFIDAKCIGETS